MSEEVNYRKPSMTDLPKELGIRIFRQILNSPAPDTGRKKDSKRETRI